MNGMAELAIRVDIDTCIGLEEGVPQLLDLFRRYQVRASFFVSLGPDHSGRALRRLWRPSFLYKMLRTNPLRLYGVRTLLSGTLLPARRMSDVAPASLRAILSEGHELGIHGYDHVRWQDHVDRMTDEEIEAELTLSKLAYEKALGTSPRSSAAPGWRCTVASLSVQEKFRFLYASDVRGTRPFVPVHEGRIFDTVQIPTTCPTMDEMLGRQGDINGLLISSLDSGTNVHTIHAEVEGRFYNRLFESFLATVARRKIRFVTLKEIAEALHGKGLENLPRHKIAKGRIPGRSGWVTCQGSVQ
jgi:peptidoglycan/xylan/chitin deacetylase (PgdA/CDA1 family)